ncbi:hypothetical protein Anas_03799 [Armadillidium nasatum]|uniref:Uncharacterized protein n=1 Tax=Armadillidium nasatum TaxID=96803 RepID=A0A5N5SPW6_9CRUS|nr:hypothetical protein Anas_03799 [Armadillidium nasatum]
MYYGINAVLKVCRHMVIFGYMLNLEDIVISENIPTFGPNTPQPWVSCDYTFVDEQKKSKEFYNHYCIRFQLTSQRNQHRSSCNFSEDFTTIFDLENTRYCALPSREERYRLIPFVEESSVPIEDKMSNPKVFYHLNNLSLLEEASLLFIFYSAAELCPLWEV